MNCNIYFESSVTQLKPGVFSFLEKLASLANAPYIVAKIKDIAAKVGQDSRTVSRHLKTLADSGFIETKARRGKGGGTVICFNSDLVQFTTSDKALINSEEPIDIDELLQTKIPKKKQEPNPNKRPRRTKSQMVEAQLLQDEKQAKIDELNGRLQMLGGVPNWDWFQLTDNPVGNYRTYLLTRLYNRYAALFTDYHNVKVQVMGEGEEVPEVSNDYDVLGTDKVLGTSRWAQFEKFRDFCDENSIDPAVYLTAQFNRSLFTAKGKKAKNFLPFVNALTSDTSYDAYLQYCDHKARVDEGYKQFKILPKKFASDFVVSALSEAYDTADRSLGMLEHKHSIREFLKGEHGFTEKQVDVINFYDSIVDKLRETNAPFQVRNTIKKYIITQALTQLFGNQSLPISAILGSEHTQVILATIDRDANNKEEATFMKKRVLGTLLNPNATNELKDKDGATYLYQLRTLKETRQVLRLIQERKGTHVSLADLHKAFEAFGRTEIPVDDFSMLNIDAIVELENRKEQQEQEIDLASVTAQRKVVMSGSVVEQNPVDDVLAGLQMD